jgi:hypothetical protein
MVASAIALVMSQAIAPAAQSSPNVAITWTEGAVSPVAATRWDGAVVGNKVYFLGFRAADNSTDGSIWYYDTDAQTYTDTGIDMAVAISNYTIAVLNDNTGLGLYTFGGRNAAGETTNVVQVFYPDTGTSQVLASDPWPGLTTTGCVTLAATGVTTKGKKAAYVVGGTSFSTSIPPCADDNSDEVWKFSPKAADGSKWSQQPSLNVARGYLAPSVVGKKLYAIGGNVNTAGTLTASQKVEGWKIGAAAWKDAPYADLPDGEACDETQAFGFAKGALAKTITLAGCGQWPLAKPDVVQYDIVADTWAVTGALNEARRNHAGVNIGTASSPELAVFGGYNLDGSATLATSEFGTVGALSGDRTATAPAAKPGSAAGNVPAF